MASIDMCEHDCPGSGCRECIPDKYEKKLAPLLAEIERLKILSVTNILLAVVPGDGEGHEVYAKSVDDVVSHLTKLDERLEAGQQGEMK